MEEKKNRQKGPRETRRIVSDATVIDWAGPAAPSTCRWRSAIAALSGSIEID